jgi:hypothetical protein
VLAMLSIGGIIESVTGTNLWEHAFGIRPLDDTPRDLQRFGFKRAYGTCMHSIFFGMLLFTLLPWPLMIATGEGTARRRTIALGIAMLGCLGVASSVSRGPILAVMLMFLAGFACRTASRKWAIGGLALLAAGWITFDWSQAHEWIKRSSGNVNRRTISIQLEGETLQNDSTNYRWLIVKAYWPALSRAGLLGYGTAAVSTFPPRIPNLPESARARRMLRSVDNAYLLIGLRFGWLGMLALASLLLVSIWTCSRLFGNPAFRDLSGWLMAMLSAVAPVLLIEWLSYDFGFALLWSCGAVGGLAALAQGDMFMLDRSIHSGRNSSGRGRIEAR